MRRALRQINVALLAASLLFAQLATAAHACSVPMQGAMVSPIGTPFAARHAESSDEGLLSDAKNVCIEHCAETSASTDHQGSLVALAAGLLPRVGIPAPTVLRHFCPATYRVQYVPDLNILHCRLLI